MIDEATPGNLLRPVLTALGLARPRLGWYEATRHTFAAHWVLGGGSIEKLKEILTTSSRSCSRRRTWPRST